ncbi:MAG: DUF2203 family protein [Planctomycetota bacterium]
MQRRPAELPVDPTNADVPQASAAGLRSALFTAERATATLPLVSRIVADAVPLAMEIAERRARLSWIRRTPRGKRRTDGPHAEEVHEIERGLTADVDRLGEYEAEIRRLGAVLRTAEEGLVEFPGPRADDAGDRRDGFFSWRPGEESVTHWRPAHADPSDREPLRRLLAAALAVNDLTPSDQVV